MTLEEIAELEKIMNDMLYYFEAVNEKYEDIKSKYSSSENVNVEEIDAAISEMMQSYVKKFNDADDKTFEIYMNFGKRILNEY